MFKVLDLFSGIGGFSLGLERSNGFQTVAFCEIDPFCRRVLARHWPEVPCYDDIRELTGQRLADDGIEVDAICGGFPCQDISFAGAGAGLAGERSGLWREYARLIGEIRPQYVIVENVAALLSRGLGDVLGDLATLGYDAEWHCIPAAAVGAPHRRDRVWIVAYASGERPGEARQLRCDESAERFAGGREAVADAGCAHGQRWPDEQNLSNWQAAERHEAADNAQRRSQMGNADGVGLAQRQGEPGHARPKFTTVERTGWWLVEPDVGRVANGIPARVDRLRSLGNAVVPQIPELIGRAILEAHNA